MADLHGGVVLTEINKGFRCLPRVYNAGLRRRWYRSCIGWLTVEKDKHLGHCAFDSLFKGSAIQVLPSVFYLYSI